MLTVITGNDAVGISQLKAHTNQIVLLQVTFSNLGKMKTKLPQFKPS